MRIAESAEIEIRGPGRTVQVDNGSGWDVCGVVEEAYVSYRLRKQREDAEPSAETSNAAIAPTGSDASDENRSSGKIGK